MSTLHYGDNLVVMSDQKNFPDESVDLIYLDPPFNSNRDYNAPASASGSKSGAQIKAFDDTWIWNDVTKSIYDSMKAGKLGEKIKALVVSLHDGIVKEKEDESMLAYLMVMIPRLFEFHRILKQTGVICLHCDQTAAHYLKIALDVIFGRNRFITQVTWVRTSSHGNVTKNFGSIADTILIYSKSDVYTWNQLYRSYAKAYLDKNYRFTDPDGRRWKSDDLSNPSLRPNLMYDFTASNGVTYKHPSNGWVCTRERMEQYDREGLLHFPAKKDGRLRRKKYRDTARGVKLQNVWDDIHPVNSQSKERLDSPTQKPMELLERIILAFTNENHVVMDPYAGCGTAMEVARKLKRKLIGIDVCYQAIKLIHGRLNSMPGAESDEIEILGVPYDVEGARALFEEDTFQFQRWAVSAIGGTPNEKQSNDKGVDGRMWFEINKKKNGVIVVSVKGGKNVGPKDVRELLGTVASKEAEMGVLISMNKPTKEMVAACKDAGHYKMPRSDTYPKIQIITVAEILAGKAANTPKLLEALYRKFFRK